MSICGQKAKKQTCFTFTVFTVPAGIPVYFCVPRLSVCAHCACDHTADYVREMTKKREKSSSPPRARAGDPSASKLPPAPGLAAIWIIWLMQVGNKPGMAPPGWVKGPGAIGPGPWVLGPAHRAQQMSTMPGCHHDDHVDHGDQYPHGPMEATGPKMLR